MVRTQGRAAVITSHIRLLVRHRRKRLGGHTQTYWAGAVKEFLVCPECRHDVLLNVDPELPGPHYHCNRWCPQCQWVDGQDRVLSKDELLLVQRARIAQKEAINRAATGFDFHDMVTTPELLVDPKAFTD